MLSLDQAIEKMLELKQDFYINRDSETVLLTRSFGRELSEAVLAESMSPEFDIAAMDGYALRAQDEHPLRIKGRAYAGDNRIGIKRGEAAAIATGAILPLGADAVLKMEDAEVKDDLLYGIPLRKWNNVFGQARIIELAIRSLRRTTG